MKLNENDIEIIEKNKKYVDSAYFNKVVISMPNEAKNELQQIYTKWGYSPQNIACSSCLVGMLMTIGIRYYNYLDEKEKEKQIEKDCKDIKTKKDNNNLKKKNKYKK